MPKTVRDDALLMRLRSDEAVLIRRAANRSGEAPSTWAREVVVGMARRIVGQPPRPDNTASSGSDQ